MSYDQWKTRSPDDDLGSDIDNKMSKVKMVCEDCGSDDILSDAYQVWNVDKQEWQLQDVFDKSGFCKKCNSLCYIEEEEIEESEI